MPLRECKQIGRIPNPRAKGYPQAAIEANAYYVTVILECLLQSHGGVIRLFPGIPDERKARFFDLRARGAFLVSSEKGQRGVRYVRIKSLKGGTAAIENAWPGPARYRQGPDGETVRLKTDRGQQIQF